MLEFQIRQGHCLEELKRLPDEAVHCIVTSPPYYPQIRDYGVEPTQWGDGWEGCLGYESTPQQYVLHMVEVLREARRVLRSDGSLWFNIGDSYAKHNKWDGIKKKDLIGIPWMLAFAMRADGWYLRQDNIWCLSGGVSVYARINGQEQVINVQHIHRDYSEQNVELWNGLKWTKMVRIWETPKDSNAIEIELRSGENIGCSSNHRFPIKNENIEAKDLRVGDILETTTLPEPDEPVNPKFIPDDVGWIIGLYLAEGNKIQRTGFNFSLNSSETYLLDKIKQFSDAYGGTFCVHKYGNNMTVRIYGEVANSVIDKYISGKGSLKKHLSPACFRRSNNFLEQLLNGYLIGDGHYDKNNNRWRLGFGLNDALARNMRVICARLGYSLRLKRGPAINTTTGKKHEIWKGQIRFVKSDHFNNKQDSEIVAIRKSRGRRFFDITVEDEPHLFALSSGILTHNSKPDAMPESAKDRTSKSHEYLFHFTKTDDYFFDTVAIREDTHNKRTVWSIPTANFKDGHFAVYPRALVNPCILSSTSAKGVCEDCSAPYKRQIVSERIATRPAKNNKKDKTNKAYRDHERHITVTETIGWEKICKCENSNIKPAIVLDPFSGAGTTGVEAICLNRAYFGIELNSKNAEMSRKRISEIDQIFVQETSNLFKMQDIGL